MSSRVLCVKLRSRRRVRCTRLVSVVRMSRAASPRPQYSTRTILPNILLSSSRRQKLAHRSSHRFSSQLSGWRTRIAGSKAAKLVAVPHVRKDWLQSACRGPAGAPLEHQDWHDGTRERLTVDRVAYRVRAGHFVHDSRPLGSGAHLAAVNGYRSSGDGGEEESRHGIRDHSRGTLEWDCESRVFLFVTVVFSAPYS